MTESRYTDRYTVTRVPAERREKEPEPPEGTEVVHDQVTGARVWVGPAGRDMKGPQVYGRPGTHVLPRVYVYGWLGWVPYWIASKNVFPGDEVQAQDASVLNPMVERLPVQDRVRALTSWATRVHMTPELVSYSDTPDIPRWSSVEISAQGPNGVQASYQQTGGRLSTKELGPLPVSFEVEVAADGAVSPQYARDLIRKKVMEALVSDQQGPMGEGVWVKRIQFKD